MSRRLKDAAQYRIYGPQFFRSLTLRVLRRCGLERYVGEMAPELPAPVTQFALWSAMREMTDYMSQKGCQSFLRASLYHDCSQPLTPRQIEADLVELAVWYAGKNGYTTRLGAPFPQSEYEECVLLALFYALLGRALAGEEFGPAFEVNVSVPQGGRVLQVHQAVYGRTPKERWEGYVPVRQWISAPALERMENFLVHLPADERPAFKEFVDGCVGQYKIEYLTRACLLRIMSMYCAMRQGQRRRGALWAACWPPLLTVVSLNARRKRKDEDCRELPVA
ncbi:hypothetical protein HYW17_05315 [Candidatus Uhrbacteria bacterium]|nr:hypothetical protein [Candidatus Uhrbacteria bacterium]